MYEVLVIGGGSIGERHLRCFLKTGRAAVAVCDSRPERLAELSHKYSVMATYPDFEKIDLERFDAAVVCVPGNLHVPYAQRVADAGVHVLIEKPLSLSTEGIEELQRTVEEKKLTVAVGHVRRATDTARAMKAEIASGLVGEVLDLVYHVGYDHRVARPDYRNTYAVHREQGGGAIFDICSHLVNLIQWYLGPIRSVIAAADHQQVEGTDVEDSVSLLLRFRNSNARANVHCLMWQANRVDQISVAGPLGSIQCDNWNSRIGIFLRARNEWTWTDIPKPKPDAKGQVDDPFIAQATNFLDAVEGKAKPFCTLAEGRHTIEVCLAAHESAQRQGVVTLNEGEELLSE
jgi:predicted dehydrogenase